MRFALSIFALIALSSSAATSQIRGTNDFVFTRVTASTNITGIVMGDSGDYGTMRFEDLAWLHEAIEERLAFTEDRFDFTTNVTNSCTRHEFGRWSVDGTNGVLSSICAVTSPGTTQTVYRSLSVTNLLLPRGVKIDPAGGRMIKTGTIPTGSLNGLFASSNNVYISSSSLGYPFGSTNDVAESDEHVISTTQRLEIVSHSLTNGTVEVHTNKVYFLATNTVHRCVTNASYASVLDLCCTSGRFGYEYAEDVELDGLFRKSAITNAYGIVRRCDKPVCIMYTTNDFPSIWRQRVYGTDYSAEIQADGHYKWHEVTTDVDDTGTNHLSRLYVNAYGSKSRKTHHYRQWNASSGQEFSLEEKVGESKSIYSEMPERGAVLSYKAPFRLCVTRFGALANRISGGRFFLIASVSASIDVYNSGEQTREIEHAVTNAYVSVPVSMSLDNDGLDGEYARFIGTFEMSDALFSAANAIGFSIPYDISGITSPDPPPVPDGGSESYANRYYKLEVAPVSIVAVIELDPITKLTGW